MDRATRKRAVAGAFSATIVAGAVGWAVLNGAASDSDVVGARGTGEPTDTNRGAGAGETVIAPVVVPVAHVDEPFEITYAESELGAEITDNAGDVVRAATLETFQHRLTYRSSDDWEIHNLDLDQRTVYRDGTLQVWERGEMQWEQPAPDQGVPARLAMPLALDEFHAHVAELGFVQTDRAAARGKRTEAYERQVPRPTDGEFYRSLPWRAGGNVERVTIEFEETSRRIVSYTKSLNGTISYAYELLR